MPRKLLTRTPAPATRRVERQNIPTIRRTIYVPETYASRTRPRVYILTDIRLYREGLASSLLRYSEIEVIGSGTPNSHTVTEIASLSPSAVVLDITMPEALALAKEIFKLPGGIKVIAFAVRGFDHELLACASAGIAGYVAKDGSVDDIVSSIQSALSGELICSPRFPALLVQKMAILDQPHTPPSKSTLTRREHEILGLINEGQSNKQIARLLRIAEATVKNHVHNLLTKLNVSRRGQAAAWLRGQTAKRLPTYREHRSA